jgi:hypothetical protein
VEFEDAVAVRFADDTTRLALFDQASLASVAAAGYNHPEIEGPYTAVFDSVDLAVDLPPRVHLRGTVRRVEDARPYELDLIASGLPHDTPRVTALWRGSVAARFRPAGEPVTGVESQWKPQDGSTLTGGVKVTLAAPAATTAAQVRRLPVTAAVLARDASTGVGTLLREAATVRERLVDAGFEAPADPQLRRRNAVVVVWLLPASVFEDDSWPVPAGTDPAHRPEARRSAATAWLARHGIALVPTTFS